MIPQRRFSTLLHQARVYQRQHCVYHNSPLNSTSFSLYSDHRCNKSDFPRITTTILEVHKDEVWNIEWSHDGAYLASASKDKSAIIWRRGVSVLCSAGNLEMKLMIMFIKVTTWFWLIVTTRLGCTSYPTWPSISGRMLGLVAWWHHPSHKRGPLYQALEYEGETSVWMLLDEILTPDPKDWRLYSHTWRSYRDRDCYLMATGRIRLHIWGFRPKDHHLGKSNTN